MSNIGSTGNMGNTSPTKSTGASDVKRAPDAPIEHVKKFEDALDKKNKESPAEDAAKSGKKEGDSPFDLLKKVKVPSVPEKQVPSGLAKDQVVQAAIDKEKGKSKSDDSKKGEGEGKSQAFGKDGNVLQPVQGRSKDEGDKKGGGQESKDKREEKQAAGKLASDLGLAPVQGQQPAVGPLGQPAPVSSPQQVAASAAVKEIAELAAKMLDRMLVSDARLSAGKEVRMTFGDTNSNLKNVDFVIKKEGNLSTINIDTTKNKGASDFINQNMQSLTKSLHDGLQGKGINNIIIKGTGINEISIDIPKAQSDTQKDDSQGRSRGEYYNPDEDQP